MITDSDPHVRGQRIHHECIDPRAHGVELRTARRDSVTHRSGDIRKEVQIGHRTRRAGPILANTIAGFVAPAAMRRIRHRIDALPAAICLVIRTDARAVQTSRAHGTRHIASTAMLRIGHRIDAAHAARRSEARAERIGTRISARAGLATTAAIQRIGFRVDTRAITRGCSAGTNALPIHARRRAGTSIVTHPAMLVARHLVDAIHSACIGGRTCTRTRLTYGQARTGRVFVEHSIAVVIFPVAFFHGSGVRLGQAVVAIHSTANDGRLAVFILVERRKDAYGRRQIAVNIRLARIAAELLNANRVVGANRNVDATFINLTKLARRTRRRAAVRSYDVLTHSRIARIDGAIESIIAVGSDGTATRTTHARSSPRAAHSGCAAIAGTTGSRTTHSAASGARHHAPGTAGISAAGARIRTRRRIAARTVAAYGRSSTAARRRRCRVPASDRDCPDKRRDSERDRKNVFPVFHG